MKKVTLSIFIFALSFWATSNIAPSFIKSLLPDYEHRLNPKMGIIYKNIDDYFGTSLYLKMETFRITESMSDDQKVGMVLMPAFENGDDVSDIKNWIGRYKIGGFMDLSGKMTRSEIDSVKKYSDELGNLPLFVSLDAEPSLIKYRTSGIDGVKDTDQIKDTSDAIEQAKLISGYLLEKGFNLNFAPVYDNDKNKSVIGDRSFGGSKENITLLAGVFSEASKDKKILTTAKHFPGHGSVSGDTHKSLQVIQKDLTELESFRSAIDQDVPFMMVGHLAVDSDDEKIDTDGLPSTLSKKIMTDLLKEDLGFEGIVITDAMNMGALNQFDNLNVRSLKAGADILLMPRDLESAHAEILSEVKNSEEFRDFIDQKVRKIVRMKLVVNWLD